MPSTSRRAAALLATLCIAVAFAVVGTWLVVDRDDTWRAEASMTPAAAHTNNAPMVNRVGTPAFVVGDSLTVMSEPYLARALKERGYTPMISGHNGRPTLEGLAVLQQAADTKTLPNTVIVALGTNDLANPDFVGTVNRVMTLLGPGRQVYWVNIYFDVTKDPHRWGYQRLNQVINAAATSHPNLHVLDWNSEVSFAHQEGIVDTWPDGTHYLPEGSRLRARFIAQQLPNLDPLPLGS